MKDLKIEMTTTLDLKELSYNIPKFLDFEETLEFISEIEKYHCNWEFTEKLLLKVIKYFNNSGIEINEIDFDYETIDAIKTLYNKISEYEKQRKKKS